MKNFRFFLLAHTFLFCAATPSFAAQGDLTLTQVVLSSSGLGQYTFDADVDGNAELRLPVRREHVNDILKSLVVLDGKGKVSAVTLPGDEGLSTLFRSLPFQQDAFSSLNNFILATRGQTITVEGSAKATGQIMTLTPTTSRDGNGKETTQHILSLLTDDGLKQVVLEQVTVLRYEDPKLNEALKRAMQGFAAQTNNDQRQISIALRGDAERNVAVSYTIESPVWKVAYRLRLAPAENKKDEGGFLQGWAIVENSSAEDWKNVQLTLTSGSPVTYQQALYPSYFVQRPILPLPIPNTIQPRIDSGLMRDMAQSAAGYAAPSPAPAMMLAKRQMMAPQAADMAMAESVAMDASGGMTMNSQFAGGQNTPVIQQQTTQMSLTFPEKVSVPSGSSLMVPFWAAKISGDVQYLYQPDINSEHPFASVTIKNGGANTLPPGIVTLYQATTTDQPSQFVGDANMPNIPSGEERLVPFALDQDTKIGRVVQHRQNITKISAAKGVLTLSSVQEQKNSYTVKAPKNKSRTIVIEEPKMDGWKLVEPDVKTVKETSTHYRIEKSLKAAETALFDTILQYTNREEVIITNLGREALLGYINSGGAISADAKKALQEAAEKRRIVEEIDQKIALAESQKQSLYGEQERLRKNLKAVPENSDLSKRYLKTLDDQENQIQSLEKQIDMLRKQRAEAWGDFADFVPSLTF